MDFKVAFENIKNTFSKEELKFLDLILPFDKPKLANSGDNDTEGYQVFTPEFIVRDIVKAIGENEVFDLSKTVLEPTSGDGAFTTYILLRRLEKAFKENKTDFEINALKCLSTIYSVEMDKDLIIKQRNNAFTCLVNFFDKYEIAPSDGFFDVAKCIIVKNFLWAMFNTEQPLGALLGIEVAFKMPDAEKSNYKSLDFAVWNIDGSNTSYHMEGVDADLW